MECCLIALEEYGIMNLINKHKMFTEIFYFEGCEKYDSI